MKYYILFLLSCTFIFSCSSKKNILYLQSDKDFIESEFTYENYKIKTDDILKIEVGTQTIETSLTFNSEGKIENNNGNKDSELLDGYQVDNDGFINFPVLGKVFVFGKTKEEVRDDIYEKIIDAEFLTDPHIDVKIINMYFTVVGEVKNPGRYDFLNNNFNIFDAIGMAGDLTINGVRENIKIIRHVENKKIIIDIDLTQKNILNNKNFQIFSGDIIVVNPNYNRVKNAGIIGNSGTLLSLLSFVLSSIILITNR